MQEYIRVSFWYWFLLLVKLVLQAQPVHDPCSDGSYGLGCALACRCFARGTRSCDPISGSCDCNEAWMGELCDGKDAITHSGLARNPIPVLHDRTSTRTYCCAISDLVGNSGRAGSCSCRWSCFLSSWYLL